MFAWIKMELIWNKGIQKVETNISKEKKGLLDACHNSSFFEQKLLPYVDIKIDKIIWNCNFEIFEKNIFNMSKI